MADYVYSIANDFPNHKVDPSRLAEEVRASSIVTALDVVLVVGDACTVVFKASLSANDETVLDGLVAVHSGEPIDPEPVPVEVANPTLTVNAMPPSGLKSNQNSQNRCDRTTS